MMSGKNIFYSLIFLSSVAFNTIAISEETLTPKAALERLMEGNKRFMADNSLCPNRNQDRRTATVESQKPFAIILGCSDSRIPPELAFDQGIGDIFVVRVAGNVVGPTELDSIEYSAIYNHSSIVVVLGHKNCGAVKAVLTHNTQDVESIAELIQPALDKKENLSLDEAVEANVQHSVAVIKKSPVISKLIQQGKIEVVGGYYNLRNGEIVLLKD